MDKKVLISIFLAAAMILFLGTIAYFSFINKQEPTMVPAPPATTTARYAGGEWKTYQNNDLGLEFEYPEGLKVTENKELEGSDSGKLRTITVRSSDYKFSATIQAASPDYEQGVGEGCCFFYVGEKIDLSLSDAALQKEMDSQLGNGAAVLNMQRQTIGDKASVRFFRINSYGEQWIQDTALIPLDGPVFTNLLISSPGLASFETDKPYDEIAEYVNSDQFLSDEAAKENYSLFTQILSTLKFTK